MVLLFLEFLGTTELLVVALVALIIFGPRKLPELGRSLGKSLGEFKRASEDFKRTWEREVEVDRIERDVRIEREIRSNPVMLENGAAQLQPVIEHESAAATAATTTGGGWEGQTIARATTATSTAAPVASTDMTASDASSDSTEPTATGAPEPTRKQDWL